MTTSFDGALTGQLLQQAMRAARGRAAGSLLSDDGRENHGALVAEAAAEAGIVQHFAQITVTYSNSMIEAFWRSIKHNFLYMQRLTSFTELQRFVAFYVQQHNTVIPHAAFHGQTPEEVFEGIGHHLRATLADKRRSAREQRLAANRQAACARCPRPRSSRSTGT